MRTIIQAEPCELSGVLKIPYAWTEPKVGEAVQIVLGDGEMTPLAIGEVSQVESINAARWRYEVKVTRIL